MGAKEVLEMAKVKYPDTKFSTDKKEQVIGQWSDKLNRYIVICCQAISGEWVDMPYEIKVNRELPKIEWTA